MCKLTKKRFQSAKSILHDYRYRLHTTGSFSRQVFESELRSCWQLDHQALKAITINGAYQLKRDNEIGSLAVGKYADLVELSADIYTVPAEKIIEQQAATFDPTEFKDRYEDALRELIARKKKGKAVTPDAEPEEDDGKVIDLMEALKKSLKGGGAKKRAA